MNPEVAKILSELSSKMGTTVEYLWPKLVAYAQAKAIIGVVGCVIAFLVGVLAYVLSFRSKNVDVRGVGLIASVSLVVASLIAAFHAIPDAMVPEASAIRMLLGQ